MGSSGVSIAAAPDKSPNLYLSLAVNGAGTSAYTLTSFADPYSSIMGATRCVPTRVYCCTAALLYCCTVSAQEFDRSPANPTV